MSEIQFEEPHYHSIKIVSTNERPGMVRFLLKMGVVKSEKQANIVLLAISMVFFIAMFLVIYSNFFRSPPITPRQQLTKDAIANYRKQGINGIDLINKIKEDERAGKFE